MGSDTQKEHVEDIQALLNVRGLLTAHQTQDELRERITAWRMSFVGRIEQADFSRFHDQSATIIEMLIRESYGWKTRAMDEHRKNTEAPHEA